jgi:hypothetical protein
MHSRTKYVARLSTGHPLTGDRGHQALNLEMTAELSRPLANVERSAPISWEWVEKKGLW